MAFSIFSVLEIFTFLYYVNEETDDVIDDCTKMVQPSIKNIFRNITQGSLNLAPEMYITKKKNQNDTNRTVAMTTVMPLVLF